MTECLTNLTLPMTSIVSGVFHVKLLAYFVLKGIGLDAEIGAQLLTAMILIFIGYTGWRRLVLRPREPGTRRGAFGQYRAGDKRSPPVQTGEF